MPNGRANAAERLEARVSPELKKLFKEAAAVRGVTLTDFVVNSAHEVAVRTLQDQHVLELSREDQRVFVEALLNPAPPNEKLRRAWIKHASAGRRRRSQAGKKR